jgi:hypothetical protein
MEREYASAGILLATRTHGYNPPLPGAWQIAIRELDSEQRHTYLSRRLEERSGDLLSQIIADPTLDALTRTPLMLSEVVRLFEAARSIPVTKLGILAAMMRRVEESDEHRIPIEASPLLGRAGSYLAALALRMTGLGRVDLSDEDARSTLARESTALREAGQLSTTPEPQAIVIALCAHHVLQRLDYPTASYRFQHQQFQEFYAALRILERLTLLVDQDDTAAVRDFQIKYLDRPVWEEALTMVADAVGAGSPILRPHPYPINIGEKLVRCAIPVDPVFAAVLARRCGDAVWDRIVPELGPLLRRWYAVDDAHHQRCALAAMLATGSNDFLDIILPLLTNTDQQIRLESYRAFDEFHLSSLGPDWRSIVEGWDEGQRIDFVGSVLRDAGHATLAQEFAASDPSPRVRRAAFHALLWIGAEAPLARVLDIMDGPDLVDTTSYGLKIGFLSETAKARVLSTLRERAEGAGSATDRLRAFLRLAEFGDSHAPEDLRTTLAALTETDLRNAECLPLAADTIKAIRASDKSWANTWISAQIAEGVLSAESWIPLVDTVPPDLVVRILTRIGSEETDFRRLRNVIALITKAADLNLAKRIWQRLVEVSTPATDEPEGRPDPLRAALRSQMEDLAGDLPPSLRVSGAIETLSAPPTPGEYRAVLSVFGRAAEEGDLRAELPEQLRRSLLDVLIGAIPHVLEQGDFHGGLKASLALAMARVGGPENVQEILSLIRADIERVRKGLDLRARGDRGSQANGAFTRWANWYVKALGWLGADVPRAHFG